MTFYPPPPPIPPDSQSSPFLPFFFFFLACILILFPKRPVVMQRGLHHRRSGALSPIRGSDADAIATNEINEVDCVFHFWRVTRQGTALSLSAGPGHVEGTPPNPDPSGLNSSACRRHQLDPSRADYLSVQICLVNWREPVGLESHVPN